LAGDAAVGCFRGSTKGHGLKAGIIGALLALSAPAHAQIAACALPDRIPAPRPAGPSTGEPRRLIPTAAYTLAMSWSPQVCVRAGRSDDYQCDTSRNRFGFVLHGLWPDGAGRHWPQYCRAAPLLSPELLRRNLCATPSVDLLQHEWAKHGTCMTAAPERYFTQARSLYVRVRFPDMDDLATERGLTVHRFTQSFLAVNQRLDPRAVRVRLTREGWLDELWLCVDRKLRFAACLASQGGGAAPDRPMRIRPPR